MVAAHGRGICDKVGEGCCSRVAMLESSVSELRRAHAHTIQELFTAKERMLQIHGAMVQLVEAVASQSPSHANAGNESVPGYEALADGLEMQRQWLDQRLASSLGENARRMDAKLQALREELLQGAVLSAPAAVAVTPARAVSVPSAEVSPGPRSGYTTPIQPTRGLHRGSRGGEGFRQNLEGLLSKEVCGVAEPLAWRPVPVCGNSKKGGTPGGPKHPEGPRITPSAASRQRSPSAELRYWGSVTMPVMAGSGMCQKSQMPSSQTQHWQAIAPPAEELKWTYIPASQQQAGAAPPVSYSSGAASPPRLSRQGR